MYSHYTTPTEEKQRNLKRHWFLKNRYFFFFPRKKTKLLNKHRRWRKVAKILKLSKAACQRLEWIIFYETKAQHNARATCRHFYISRKTFYKWLNRFDEKNLRTLGDRDKAPKNKRKKEITPVEETRIISLRKQYLAWGKLKLQRLYQNIYKEKISSWKIQYTIKKYKLYPHPAKNEKLQKKKKEKSG